MDNDELDDKDVFLGDENEEEEEEGVEDPLSMGFHEVDAFEPEQDF